MGFFKRLSDTFSMGPTDSDVRDVLDRRDAESRARTARLANKSEAELAAMLASERARMPGLLDAGVAKDVDDCSRLVGDIMAAQEQQKRLGR
jgi:hypothetical protein